jgi:hypothetical protein
LNIYLFSEHFQPTDYRSEGACFCWQVLLNLFYKCSFLQVSLDRKCSWFDFIKFNFLRLESFFNFKILSLNFYFFSKHSQAKDYMSADDFFAPFCTLIVIFLNTKCLALLWKYFWIYFLKLDFSVSNTVAVFSWNLL